MDDSLELIVFFWCGHVQRQQGEYYVTASWVPYHIDIITLGDTTVPLVWS